MIELTVLVITTAMAAAILRGAQRQQVLSPAEEEPPS